MQTHAKLQKRALGKLKDALQFYKQRLGEVEDFQRRVFEEKEAQEMKEKLQELDKNIVLRKLEFLQEKVSSIQDLKNSQLDQQLRIVADKLYELDKTFIEFNDILDELRVTSSEVKVCLHYVFWREEGVF
jgi:archaellum component FlaC